MSNFHLFSIGLSHILHGYIISKWSDLALVLGQTTFESSKFVVYWGVRDIWVEVWVWKIMFGIIRCSVLLYVFEFYGPKYVRISGFLSKNWNLIYIYIGIFYTFDWRKFVLWWFFMSEIGSLQFNFSNQNLSIEHNFFKWDGKVNKI